MKLLNIILLIVITSTAVFAEAKSAWSIQVGFEGFEEGEKGLGSGGFWGGAGQSQVTKEISLEGKSAKIWVYNKQTGYGKWGGEWRLPEKVYEGETIWFSVHTYMPETFDYSSYGQGSKLKFLRLSTKTKDGQHIGFDDLYINPEGSERPFSWIYEGDKRWWHVGFEEDKIEKGVWENYQMAVTFGHITKKNGGKAEVKIWKNGRLISHIDDRKTLKYEGAYADRALLFTYWNGGAPKQQEMYVDQIIITNIEPEWYDANGFSIIPFFTDLCRLPN